MNNSAARLSPDADADVDVNVNVDHAHNSSFHLNWASFQTNNFGAALTCGKWWRCSCLSGGIKDNALKKINYQRGEDMVEDVVETGNEKKPETSKNRWYLFFLRSKVAVS